MSIHLKSTFLASALLVAASSYGATASAQAVSTPSTDQAQSANSAVQKAQNSTGTQPVNNLPSSQNVINEQPGTNNPSTPPTMVQDPSGKTGAVPSAQKNPRRVKTHHHGHKTAPATQNTTSSPE